MRRRTPGSARPPSRTIPTHPFEFADRRHPSLVSGYAQDVFQASDRVTVNFGVRVDRGTQLVDATAWSPRVGAAWRAREGTTIRASLMRLFQPPQAEYLLLASSEQARALSPFADDEDIGGGSAVPPERQTAVEVSLVQDVAPGWTLDAAAWRRRGTDVDDPNVFFGTTVTVPNSVARQHAAGFDLRLAMAPRRGWSGSVGYSHARVVQFGPVTGGLFLEDEVAAIQDGTRFTPDHDQRHSVVATASYASERRRLRASGAFRYQTGTPVGVDSEDVDALRGRPGSETVDFESGRVKPRAVLDLLASWALTQGGRRTRRSPSGSTTSPIKPTPSTSAIRSAAPTSGVGGVPACRCGSGFGGHRRLLIRIVGTCLVKGGEERVSVSPFPPISHRQPASHILRPICFCALCSG